MGDYGDILSLTRILVYGPKSKADVDSVMESKELEKFPDGDDEQRANLMDMGFKALRRCITFRSLPLLHYTSWRNSSVGQTQHVDSVTNQSRADTYDIFFHVSIAEKCPKYSIKLSIYRELSLTSFSLLNS